MLCFRSLIAMATDEIGVEMGIDTVTRCKDSLHEAELKVQEIYILLGILTRLDWS